MTDVLTTTIVGDVVARDMRSAAVFARYGIDFCCGGRRSIADACRAGGVSADAVLHDLEALAPTDAAPPDFTTWPIEDLVERVVTKHHAYVRAEIPVIQRLADTLASKKADRYPALLAIRDIWTRLAADLLRHLDKEEIILFPFIRSLAQSQRGGHAVSPATPFGTIQNPLRLMEVEHEAAADDLAELRQLTNNFQPPDDACATWRAFYAELDAFERDLHEHVHLENNVLFPAAERLEEELS